MRKAGVQQSRWTGHRGQDLAPETSAHDAELVALTRALELSRGKRVNIYADSKYAFLILHVPGALWEEKAVDCQQQGH